MTSAVASLGEENQQPLEQSWKLFYLRQTVKSQIATLWRIQI
jgi:hypothetical protein